MKDRFLKDLTNGMRILQGGIRNGDIGKVKLTRGEFLATALVEVFTLARCTTGGTGGNSTETPTPVRTDTPVPSGTPEPPKTATPDNTATATATATARPTEKPTPVPCEANLAEALAHTDRLGPPDEWEEVEKKITNGGGVAIHPSVLRIANEWKAKGIICQGVDVGPGGYALEMRNAKGELIWALDANGQPAFQPDGGGTAVGGGKYEVIPAPPAGGVRIAVGCQRTMVAVDTEGNILSRFDVLKKEWKVEYPIREGFVQKVRAEVLGVPVSIDVVVDKGLQTRKANPVQKVYLNPAFPNAEKAVAEATMRALWYAWRDNDLAKAKERQEVSFEQWMGMVKDYKDGKRPLSDVEMEIWANDLKTAGYDPAPRKFDPTKPMRFVFVDRDETNRPETLAILNNSVVYSTSTKGAMGTQLNGANNLEIWGSYKNDDKIIVSQFMTNLYVRGFNRMSWPRMYQEGFSPPVPSLQYADNAVFHPEIWEKMAILKGKNAYTGALQVAPNIGETW